MTDIAVIGAGPYGLSVAAHLRAYGYDVRTFGDTMSLWRRHMPEGMRLKSEGFASSLYDPERAFSLARYCETHSLPYADVDHPVPLDVFTRYGMAFQQQFVPDVENCTLTALRPTDDGFALGFDDGSSLTARRVIVAVGVAPFAYLPPELSGFSPELVSHSSAHHALDAFAGRDVAIVGAGASAIDMAASLHRRGARPVIVARRERLAFQDAPRNPQGGRPLSQRMRWPRSGIGNGWKSVACAALPWGFRHLPEQFRLDMVRTHLGPAPCWFTRSEIEGNVPMRLSRTIRLVETADGKVRLRLNRRDGGDEALQVDHVIAATGFRPDLGRLGFISDILRTGLARAGAAPALSPTFESSVKGLYFIGPIAANTFGPLARFAFGADFATRRVMHHFPAPEPRFITRTPWRRPSRSLAP